MNNLEHLQPKQDLDSQTSKELIKVSLATAFERTGTEPYNIEPMLRDIITEFPRESEEDIIKAIRNGALGMYGRTYKLTTQEVCVWIREYISRRNEVSFRMNRNNDY